MRPNNKVQPSISRFFTPFKKEREPCKEIERGSVISSGSSIKNSTSLSQFSLNRTSPQINDKDATTNKENRESNRNGNEQSPRESFKRKASGGKSGNGPKTSAKLTPLEKSIIHFKQQNPDKMLAIQVGYKYKLFGEDAFKGAKILNIMYIRDEKDERFSYCTFPIFKLHINLNRLLVHGFKIGVIKQMESAIVKTVEKTPGSDIMRRELTAVYTKGTYMGEENVSSDGQSMLHEDEDFTEYIMCLSEEPPTKIALVAIKPSTGEIIHDEFNDNARKTELETRLTYLVPGEILVISKDEKPSAETLRCIKMANERAVIFMRDTKELNLSLESLFKNLDRCVANSQTADIKSFYSLNFTPCTLACIAELSEYLSEFKLTSIFSIPSNITHFSKSKNFMMLSSQTLRNLEIFQNSTDPNTSKGSLCWLLDHSRTKFGQRQLRSWISKPLTSKREIEERLDAIEDLKKSFNHLVDSLKNQLDKIGRKSDLEKMIMKVHYSASSNVSNISRRDVYGLLDSFNEILTLIEGFSDSIDKATNDFKSKLLLEIFQDLKKISEAGVVTQYLRMINRNFVMNNDPDIQKTEFFDLDFHNWTEISDEKAEIRFIEEKLDAELDKVRKMIGRPQLKYVTNKNEFFLIEVRNSQVDKLPKEWKKINGTTTVSRFRTPEIEVLYKTLQYHQQLLISNCDKAFLEYLVQVNNNYSKFNSLIKKLANFDCLLSLTANSLVDDKIKPVISQDQMIKVKKGRNPIIEHIISEKEYVANDIDINYDENRVLIITGPNMGGKSSYVKQVALTVILAQIGCHLPCESATIGIFDSIHIRMGARDDILNKESTFMTEMSECKYILDHMSDKSLVILDEVGRGTGTNDGIAIAYAILKYVVEHERGPLTLFITHYPSLHVLEDQYNRIVSNYHMGYLEVEKDGQDFPDIVFLYNLKKGVVSNSYGLNVAKLAGISPDIINDALEKSKDIRYNIEEQEMKTENDFVVDFFHKVLMKGSYEEDEVKKLYSYL